MENVIAVFCLFVYLFLFFNSLSLCAMLSALYDLYYDTTYPHNEFDHGHRMMEHNNIEKKKNFNIKINGHIHTHKCNL